MPRDADFSIALRLAHSPDPDDAFMWWPLFELQPGQAPAIDTGRFRFMQVTADIESLNQRAAAANASADDLLEITAISCATYPHVKERYALTACGSSMGDDYGPKLVARDSLELSDLTQPEAIIAIPGARTSAFAALSLLIGVGRFRYEVLPFERIIDAVSDPSSRFAAGLIIHEGQLTYAKAGLRLVCDLGQWWTQTRGLPLPLGVNAVRRDLDVMYGEGTLSAIASLLRQSVEYALAHRAASVRYVLEGGFARDMDAATADQFIQMYVNRWTLSFGERGRKAVRHFLKESAAAGLTPDPGEVDVIEPVGWRASTAAAGVSGG